MDCHSAVEAVLDILWGRKALVVDEDGELQQRRGKLDDADAMFLRCLMRRYGWERHDPEVPICSWTECYKASIYNKSKCVEFAWFLVLELLHTRSSPELEALRTHHNPTVVRELRESRTVVGIQTYMTLFDMDVLVSN
jgi:hypothetical protein